MRSLRLFLVAMLLLSLGIACGSRGGQERAEESPQPPLFPDLEVANAANPGEAIELRFHLVQGKQTLFEFYSDQCPPCREMERVMDVIASARDDVAIRRINIDRRGHSGIDFDSPLCEQQGITKVPYFRLYTRDGKLESEGDDARETVKFWYYEAQRPPDAGTRKIMEQYRTPQGE